MIRNLPLDIVWCVIMIFIANYKKMSGYLLFSTFVLILPMKIVYRLYIMKDLCKTRARATFACVLAFVCRSFKRHTFVHQCQSMQRLTDLAVLSIERDISDSLDLENVVDAFAQKHKNSQMNICSLQSV